VADDFSERYGDLLTGSYDCVDRDIAKVLEVSPQRVSQLLKTGS
jgi:DNA-directed RNA polymerase specialized sigma subunit